MSQKNLPMLILVVLIISTLALSLFPRARSYQIPSQVEYLQSRIIVKFKDNKEVLTKKEVNQHKDSFTLSDVKSGLSKKSIRALNEAGVINLERLFKEAKFPQERSFWQKFLNFFWLGEKIDPLANFFILNLKPDVNIQNSINVILKGSDVQSIQPDYLVRISATSPNDPGFVDGSLWNLNKIKAPEAWDLAKGSSSIKVAVIDTGINYNHEDFQGRTIINGTDFSSCAIGLSNGVCNAPKSRDSDSMDDNGHGTHVAGVIGAASNNGKGIPGINWDVTLMAVKTLNPAGDGSITDVSDAIRFAVDQGAQVINMSLGLPISCNMIPAISSPISYAINHNVIVIVAAGNDNKDASNFSPNSCPGVISVGATGPNDEKALYSNFGSTVSISAPGGNPSQDRNHDGKFTSADCVIPECIISTWLQPNSYAAISGTSMASPHVAAAAALLLASGVPSSQVRGCLINNADSIATAQIGPRLNIFRSLQACAAHPSPTNTPTPTATLTPTPNAANTPIPTPIQSGPTVTLAPGVSPTVIPTQIPTQVPGHSGIATNTPTPTPTPILIYRCDTPTPGTAGSQLQLKNLSCHVITPTP